MKTNNILFLFVILCMAIVTLFSVDATTYTQAHGNNLDSQQTYHTYGGIRISFNTTGLISLNVTNITYKYVSGGKVTYCYLCVDYGTGTDNIAICQTRGDMGGNDTCIINKQVYNNQTYLVGVGMGDGVSNYVEYYKSTSSSTINQTYVNWYGGVTGGWGQNGATNTYYQQEWNNIISVGVNAVSSGAPETPSFTLYWSAVNETISNAKTNYSFYFNGTATNAYPLGNFTVYLNNILNITMININTSQNTLVVINFSEVTQAYNLSLNGTIGNATDRKNGVQIYVDRVLPTIMTTFIDYTNITQFSTNTIYSNYSDVNLFAYQILIKDSLGAIKTNLTAINLTNTFYANTTSQIELALGNFTINFTVWDSHTLNIIPNYSINKVENGINFDNQISIISANANITYQKSIDRYNFGIVPKAITKNITIIIYSTQSLFYLPNSKHKAHFVDFENKKWIDFDTEIPLNVKYEIRQIDSKSFAIDIISTGKDNLILNPISFQSIGSLNSYSILRHYQVIATASGGVGLTVEEHNALLNLDTNVSNMWRDLKLINLIIINLVFILVCWFFAKNIHKLVILLTMSPILNIASIFLIILNSAWFSETNLNIFMILNTMVLLFFFIALAIVLLFLPKKVEQKDTLYSNFNSLR